MNAIITNKQSFTSKTGVAYVKLGYILEDGTSGELFMDSKKYDSLGIDETKICSKQTLTKIFDVSDIVKIQFDQRGQLFSLES